MPNEEIRAAQLMRTAVSRREVVFGVNGPRSLRAIVKVISNEMPH